MAPELLAHAVSVRSDLPVPFAAAALAAVAVVLGTAAALGVGWRASRLTGGAAGHPLPAGVQRVLDSRVLTGALRTAVLLVVVGVLVVALLGPRERAFNIAPYAFYVTFWVGLVPASLLLGPVWRRVSPLRTLHALLAGLSGPPPGEDGLERLGAWPAAAALLAYAWLELVLPDRADPRLLGGVLVVYGAVQLLAGLWYGPGWFARGDAFEVYSTLLGRLSPFGRRDDGRLVVRSPLDGADATPALPGLAAVVTVLVGSTAFDGVTRADWWIARYGLDGSRVLAPTLGLLATVALVAGAYALASRAVARGGPDLLAHSVIPIAAGYAVAHYLSLLLFEGQLTWILASNPLAAPDVDLFGTYRNEVDLTVVSPTTIAVVQVGAIVLGHVVGVVLAHDRAVRLGARSRAAQLPLLAVMVGLTVGGLALLLG